MFGMYVNLIVEGRGCIATINFFWGGGVRKVVQKVCGGGVSVALP